MARTAGRYSASKRIVEHFANERGRAVVDLGERDVYDGDLGAAREEVKEDVIARNHAHRDGF